MSSSDTSAKVSDQITEQQGARQEAGTLRSLGDQVSLFKYLSPMEREMIYGFSRKERFEDGDKLLQEGEPGAGLFIIDQGTVRVTRQATPDTDDGSDVELAVITAGGHFGEMSLLNQQPLSATVQAQGPVDVYIMAQDQFSSLLTLHKGLSNKLLRAMCEELSNRLRKANLYIT